MKRGDIKKTKTQATLKLKFELEKHYLITEKGFEPTNKLWIV